jgi:hypothetical protein
MGDFYKRQAQKRALNMAVGPGMLGYPRNASNTQQGGASNASNTQQGGAYNVDQRLTSFLERYLIERIGKAKAENPLEDGWLIIQDGRKIYAMIQDAGSIKGQF